MNQQAEDKRENFQVKMNCNLDNILFKFERQHLAHQSIYLVTNFHEDK